MTVSQPSPRSVTWGFVRTTESVSIVVVWAGNRIVPPVSAWTLLALRNCNPDDPKLFDPSGHVTNAAPLFTPVPAMGKFMETRSAKGGLGLTEGPLAIIQQLGLPKDQTNALLQSVFEERRPITRMSEGHRQVAQQMAPLFAGIKGYYMGIQGPAPNPVPATFKGALAAREKFNQLFLPNYSSTCFAINTLLPPDNENRVLDFVGTILFQDCPKHPPSWESEHGRKRPPGCSVVWCRFDHVCS